MKEGLFALRAWLATDLCASVQYWQTWRSLHICICSGKGLFPKWKNVRAVKNCTCHRRFSHTLLHGFCRYAKPQSSSMTKASCLTLNLQRTHLGLSTLSLTALKHSSLRGVKKRNPEWGKFQRCNVPMEIVLEHWELFPSWRWFFTALGELSQSTGAATTQQH